MERGRKGVRERGRMEGGRKERERERERGGREGKQRVGENMLSLGTE